jgi:hypothetical protein
MYEMREKTSLSLALRVIVLMQSKSRWWESVVATASWWALLRVVRALGFDAVRDGVHRRARLNGIARVHSPCKERANWSRIVLVIPQADRGRALHPWAGTTQAIRELWIEQTVGRELGLVERGRGKRRERQPWRRPWPLLLRRAVVTVSVVLFPRREVGERRAQYRRCAKRVLPCPPRERGREPRRSLCSTKRRTRWRARRAHAHRLRRLEERRILNLWHRWARRRVCRGACARGGLTGSSEVCSYVRTGTWCGDARRTRTASAAPGQAPRQEGRRGLDTARPTRRTRSRRRLLTLLELAIPRRIGR